MARIQVSHLTFAYEGSPDLIFDDASFQVDTDWKLGFIGRNGRGKTTLLRLLAGELPSHGAVLDARVREVVFMGVVTPAVMLPPEPVTLVLPEYQPLKS